MQSGVRIPQEQDLYALFSQWLADFPGAKGRAQFKLHAVIPPEFNGKVKLAPGDGNGDHIEKQMHEKSRKALLVVYGPKIYPPLRYALMKLTQDPPRGAAGSYYFLEYEKGVSGDGDHDIPKAGTHFSRITGHSLQSLYGALEKRMRDNAVENRVLGYLGQIYSALAAADSSYRKFSEYTFSSEKDGLMLQGTDGNAVTALAMQLNHAFRQESGWKPVESKAVTMAGGSPQFHRFSATHPARPRYYQLDGEPQPHGSDSRNQFAVPVEFFQSQENMEKLKHLAEKAVAQATNGYAPGR